MDGRGEAVHGKRLVRDLTRLLEADRPAQAAAADLQEDLVSDAVIRVAEQLDEDLRKGMRLSMNVDGSSPSSTVTLLGFSRAVGLIAGWLGGQGRAGPRIRA